MTNTHGRTHTHTRTDPGPNTPAGLTRALQHGGASARLQAALTAGTAPDPGYIEVLVARCGIEPDFFVRDMLTWALTRQERESTLEAVLVELSSGRAQARSQALHTLSKLGDPRAWSAITPELLQDADTEVARAAWRAAAGLVPVGGELALAAQLASQFGRGDADTRRSLSRAFVVLGDPALPVIERAAEFAAEFAAERTAERAAGRAARSSETASGRPETGRVRDAAAHALATLTIMADPEAGFEAVMAEAHRIIALRVAPARAMADQAPADSGVVMGG